MYWKSNAEIPKIWCAYHSGKQWKNYLLYRSEVLGNFPTPRMFLSTHVTATSLSSENELFLVLIRLWLGLLLEDIHESDCFSVSVPVVSRVFQKWLCVMYARLNFLKWHSREVVRKNLPPSFQQLSTLCLYYRLFWDFYRNSCFFWSKKQNIFKLQKA